MNTVHHHHHAHGHSHAPQDFGRRFLIAAAANTVFIIAEICCGLNAHSLALLADAGHNFSDVIGLLLAWGAWWLSRRAPTPRYTYGLGSSSIMAALINAVMLMAAVGGIIWEAVQRLGVQENVATGTVMAVAALGIVINGATAWLFRNNRHDLNIKAAFLHLAGDAVISLGVVIAGYVMAHTGWLWLDAAVSIAISIVVIWAAWGLLRRSINLALHAVPEGMEVQEVKDYLAALPGVKEAHDLHIWGMSTTQSALSVHLLMPGGHPGDEFLEKLAMLLHEKFGIEHATVQIEIGDGKHSCALAPDDKI